MDTFSKSVEEMSINSEEPPQEYVVKDCSFGSIESSDPSPASISIIDIGIFSVSSSHDPKEVENELEKLRSALSSGGCFQPCIVVTPWTVYVTDSMVLPSAKMHKSLEEMSINSEEPPQEYIVKDSRIGSMECSDPSLGSIPIIDINIFSLSLSDDPKEVENELEKLRSALRSGGCFQAIGHGIPSSLLDKLRQVAKQFFALPAEEKHKYSRAANEVEGYGQDRVVSEKQILDWSSRLSLKVFPEDQRRLNFWPENPSDFKGILHEYVVKLKGVMDILFKAMEKSLNLVEGSFSSQFGDNSLIKARFNFYPPCSRPDLVLGVKAHSDRSATTVLLQDDEVGGLQIFKDDKWINVPVIPHALVVNLGDQMQIMSNGIFKSPLHRVLTNTDKLRISVATFNEPEPDKEIGPVEQLIDEERPRLYRNVRNFAAFNYECFQKGKVALEEAKI